MTVAGSEPPRCAGTSKRRNSRRRTPACDMEPCFSLPRQLSVNTGTIRKHPQQWWQTVGQDSGREEHIVDPATGDRIRGHSTGAPTSPQSPFPKVRLRGIKPRDPRHQARILTQAEPLIQVPRLHKEPVIIIRVVRIGLEFVV